MVLEVSLLIALIDHLLGVDANLLPLRLGEVGNGGCIILLQVVNLLTQEVEVVLQCQAASLLCLYECHQLLGGFQALTQLVQSLQGLYHYPLQGDQ
jgi:hypothetical protein